MGFNIISKLAYKLPPVKKEMDSKDAEINGLLSRIEQYEADIDKARDYMEQLLASHEDKLKERDSLISGYREQLLLLHYRCPVCSQRVPYYKPLPYPLMGRYEQYGTHYRDYETLNVSAYHCPVCGATDAERLAAYYLSRKLLKDKEGGLMQIRSSKVLAEFITSAFPNVVQLELNPDEGGELSSLQALEDAQTDWFICMGLLERLEDDGKVISELSRILRPGGFGIVLAPVSLSLAETDQEQGLPPEERWRRFGGEDRLRLYAKQDYMDKLAESGFRVSQYGEAYFGRDVFVAMGITPSSTLYVVEK